MAEARSEFQNLSESGNPVYAKQLEKHEQFVYLICDPFNRSYSPAKLTYKCENAG